MVEDWNREAAGSRGGAGNSHRTNTIPSDISLKAYVKERLKDPETRALNASETFREAHGRITEARTPEELNRASQRDPEGQ